MQRYLLFSNDDRAIKRYGEFEPELERARFDADFLPRALRGFSRARQKTGAGRYIFALVGQAHTDALYSAHA